MRAVAFFLGSIVAAAIAGAVIAYAAGVPPIIPPQTPQWTMNQAALAVPITPTNGLLFTNGPTKAVYTAGTSGGAACTMVMKLSLDSAAQTYTNVPAGSFLPVMAVDIEATSTTCVGILALY